MKISGAFVILCLSVLSIVACSKSDPANPSNNNNNPPDTTQNPNLPDTTNNPGPVDTLNPGDTVIVENPIDSFTTYIIKAGKNYAEGTSYPAFSGSILKFKAILDSSCIYSTVNPVNQADINKLYGFSDANTHHQVNSARLGWNWLNGQMHIHAYCYAGGVRYYSELGTVPLNTPFDCSIEVLPSAYIFTLNGHKDTLSRGTSDALAKGYMLQPYFGGDEPAPHEMKVKIREL